MATNKIKGKDLRALGFPEGPVIGKIISVLDKAYKGKSKSLKLEILSRLVENPAFYKKHEIWAEIADLLINKSKKNNKQELRAHRLDYTIYGESNIEPGALNQMEIAMKLPVAVSGALMPDAHQGYGLPIGGVLATENTVIPYAVGVDIGCRMAMSVYDLNTSHIHQHHDNLVDLLLDNTRFGNAAFTRPKDDPILARNEFDDIPMVRSLKVRAYKQMGTSGGGNHFVEFGITEIYHEDNEWNVAPGKYLAVLSHSGSRGLGANIARHYTKLAMEKCQLPGEAKHLAWLDLDTEEGQEYWLAMNLAGNYASACHHQIHKRMADALGESPLLMIENHHNFAWKEIDKEGRELIVHRKGATPAGDGVVGIIPGSMTSPGFIVRGKGEEKSINSASHGAGRVMSRRKAKESLSKKDVDKHLRKAGVTVIGSGLDEAPMVYKDIHQVMDFQKDLVDILGTFTPKIVRMCGENRFKEVD